MRNKSYDTRCRNPQCRELRLSAGDFLRKPWFCVSCRRIGRDALIIGGIIGGVLLKVGEHLLKLWGVL